MQLKAILTRTGTLVLAASLTLGRSIPQAATGPGKRDGSDSNPVLHIHMLVDNPGPKHAYTSGQSITLVG